jgi:hypothetical protein
LCIDTPVLAAVEVYDLDLSSPRELNVVMDTVAVALLHCLSLASSTRRRAGFSCCGEILGSQRT